MTHAIDDLWMFCTSVNPRSDRQLTLMAQRFGAESATTIGKPSELARELGAALLANSASLDVTLTPLDKALEQAAGLHGLGTVVWVHHGPVLYCDDPEGLVSSYPDRHRAIAVAFNKRQQLPRF